VTDIQVAEGDRVSQNARLLTVYPDVGLELRARVPDRFRQELLDALASGAELQAESEDGRHRFTLARFAGTSDPAGTQAILTLNGDAGGLRPGGLLPCYAREADAQKMPSPSLTAPSTAGTACM